MNISEKIILLSFKIRQFYLLRKELYDVLGWSYDTLLLDDLYKSSNNIYCIKYNYVKSYRVHAKIYNINISDIKISTYIDNALLENIQFYTDNSMNNYKFRFNHDENSSILYITDIDISFRDGLKMLFIIESLCNHIMFTQLELDIISVWFYNKTNIHITFDY